MDNLLEFLQTHEEAFRSRTRLASLYSDFRLTRSTNPDGYEANSSAWIHALTTASRAGLLPLSQKGASHTNHLAFTSGNDLARSLQSPQCGRPLALGAVVQDAVDRGELSPLAEFLAAKKSVYHKSWVPSPWQVVGWGLKQLGVGISGSSDQLSVGDFVVMANVEAAAQAIIEQVAQQSTSLTSRIYSRTLFESTFAHSLPDSQTPLSSTDISILLTYLSRDKPALSQHGSTIKFAPPGTTHPDPVTEQDVTVANLRTLITSLQTQVDALTSKAADLERAARACIADKRLTQAKAHLRSKKLAATALEQRVATLTQLEDTLGAIETAADQVAIVQAMRESSVVLRNLHKEVGGVEGVEGVVERLREEMENVDEVNRVVQEGNVAAGRIDEGEVEDELEEMERVERERREAVEAEKTAERLRELDYRVPDREGLAEQGKEGEGERSGSHGGSQVASAQQVPADAITQ